MVGKSFVRWIRSVVIHIPLKNSLTVIVAVTGQTIRLGALAERGLASLCKCGWETVRLRFILLCRTHDPNWVEKNMATHCDSFSSLIRFVALNKEHPKPLMTCVPLPCRGRQREGDRPNCVFTSKSNWQLILINMLK